KMSRAYLLIMLITFIELLLGLNLLKLIGLYKGGYILVIALVTAIIDIVPVLGTGAVLITWSAISFFTGNIGLGIGLIVLYAAISVLRQIIEPKLVAGQVGLPAIITIMAMFVGAKLFGVFGIIILPLSVITLKLMYDEGVFAQEKT
ncbi:MAG TPA: AI-2E family transporter, partial [Clostridiales bacterium]|nr:AI-2E family transporter [Clostridiales bacterium]